MNVLSPAVSSVCFTHIYSFSLRIKIYLVITPHLSKKEKNIGFSHFLYFSLLYLTIISSFYRVILLYTCVYIYFVLLIGITDRAGICLFRPLSEILFCGPSIC